MHTRRFMQLPIALTLAAALAGCSAPATPVTTPGPRMMGGSGAPSRGSSGPAATSGTYSSLGEQIWLTGVGADGAQIAYSSPRTSQGALMMGGGGCASCHGQDGHGGTIRMMMGPAIKAPNVTRAALIKGGYTDTTIGRAIMQGLDETGAPLQPSMPRWQMSTTDLDAILAYLKTLK